MTHRVAALVLAAVALAGAGCGSATDDAPSDGGATYRLPSRPDAADFVPRVTHPFFPLPVGARWVYRKRGADGLEEITVVVTPQTRKVDGVTAVVVRDRATLDGVLSEDTYDWYAQDRSGNVWYLGEDTTAYEPGKPPSKKGSWEAGVDGARPGLVMPAEPSVGDRYQQEYLAGVAEDRGEVVATDATGRVPFGPFTDAVKTLDTTPLEPDLREHKYYAKGVGVVLEEEEGERLELVAFAQP